MRTMLKIYPFVRVVALVSFSFLLLVVPVANTAPERIQITILGTTDLHGNIIPIDYYTNKPDNRGLAKVATLVKRIRKEQPNVVLIDSGDTIQGSPLASYHNRKNPTPTDPMMLAMNQFELRRDDGWKS